MSQPRKNNGQYAAGGRGKTAPTAGGTRGPKPGTTQRTDSKRAAAAQATTEAVYQVVADDVVARNGSVTTLNAERITAELRDRGIDINERTVRRHMAKLVRDGRVLWATRRSRAEGKPVWQENNIALPDHQDAARKVLDEEDRVIRRHNEALAKRNREAGEREMTRNTLTVSDLLALEDNPGHRASRMRKAG